MELLLRRIQTDRKGNEEAFEETVTNPLFTVGHRNDQTIQLHDPQVAPRHVVLKAISKGRFDFKTVGNAQVIVDGKASRSGRLNPGDSLEIGSHRIAALEPPPEFNGLLELTASDDKATLGPTTHFRTELRQTGLGTRKVSWLLFLAIPILFLAVPLAAFLLPEFGESWQQQSVLPTDNQWLSGPLSNVHHLPEIGDNCNVCHVELFERTPDSACLDCHSNVPGHVNSELVAVASLDQMRCASCHAEHNEPANLVRSDAKLCVDCHTNPAAAATVLAGGELPAPVDEFSTDGHPDFRLAMLKQSENGTGWNMKRMPWGAQGLQERSNLKFPHDIHLDPGKVTSLQTGEALQCVNCHQLKADGEHFVPITMENQCGDCHALSFDENNPARQLPHGDVRGTVLALEEYFIRKYSDPALLEAGQRDRRRRPGRSNEEERCEGTPLECGRERALREATNQFTRSGCVTCHMVTEDPEQPPMQRWQVQPVRLASDWYPFGRFDHVAHLTQSVSQGTGETPCAMCHNARNSGQSQDILIPGSENCLACHGRDNETTTVALTCRGCHGFHLPGMGIMRTVRAAADTPGQSITSDNE